jgi:hypothetical protein
MSNASPFWTSTLQDLSIDIKSATSHGVLTPQNALWSFGSPFGTPTLTNSQHGSSLGSVRVHSLTLFALPGACDMTPGSTYRPTTSQPPCLGREPRLGLRQCPCIIKRCWISLKTPPRIFAKKNQPLLEKVSYHPSLFLHCHVCSMFTILNAMFLYPWTFETIKCKQCCPCNINNTTHNQPFPKLRDGVVNIPWASPSQNLSTKLSPCLNSYFIWIPNVI